MADSAGGERRHEAASAISPWRVLSAVMVTLGRPLYLNTIALSVALGIPAAVLFSANGLRASDVLSLARSSLWARGLLWAGWLVLSAPVLRAVFDAPGARTLRALGLPRAPLLLSLFALALVAELPWAILFARGAGPLEAWAAVTLAISLLSLGIAARRRPRFALGVALGVALVAFQPPAFARALCGCACAPLSLHAAWRCALDEPRFRWRLTRPTHALLALYAVHLLRLLRVARSRLMLAVVSSAAGGAGLVYSLRNDPSERPLQRALAAMALPLTLAAAACVAPVIESEARLRAWLRSLRVSRGCVVAAFFLAVATPSSALAASAGVAASAACHGSASVLGVTLFAWAVTLSSAVSAWGRLLEWRARRSAGIFAAGVTFIAALALLSALAW